MKKSTAILAAMAIVALVGIAQADFISYEVGGWTQQFPGPVTPPGNAPWGASGYPGDTVEFQTLTGTLDLTPGTYVQKINTLLWTIDYTYAGTATDPGAWSDLKFAFDASRSMMIGSVSSSISQPGSLDVKWENDFLGFDEGSVASFIVGGYRVDVTPLGLDPAGGTDFSGGNPWVQPSQDVIAKFEVTAVPVPGAVLLGMLGLGYAGMRLRKHS